MWSRILDAYRTSDPVAWVGVYRDIAWWAGALAAIFGGLLLLFGGGRPFRLLAAPLGAVVGLVAAPELVTRFGLAAPKELAAWIAAAGIGATSFVLPQTALVVALGVPAGFVGGALAGDPNWTIGFVAGFLLAGAVGALLWRTLACLISAWVGAWILVIGALAAMRPWVPAVDRLAAQAWGVVAVAGLVAVAGALFQLFVRPPSREARQRADTLRARREAEDRQPP